MRVKADIGIDEKAFLESYNSNSFGGDTGIDADYAPDGYICQDCDDDIELGEETLIGQEMFCPDCVEKRVK